MSSHKLFGRQLSRDTEHRIALRRSLCQSLFEHGEIRTTYPKAKEVRAMAERLITQAKTGTLLARRRVIQKINDRRLVDDNQDFITEGAKTVVQRLFTDIAPKFMGRNGGYTRVIKTAEYRIGDAGSIVVLQLLTDEKPAGAKSDKPKARKSAGLRRKRIEKKKAFAAKVLKATA